MLIIENYGRIGNKFIQIINAIYRNLISYQHRYINLYFIKKNEQILSNFPILLTFNDFDINETIITDKFWIDNSKFKISHDKYFYIIDNYIRPHINYEFNDSDLEMLNNQKIHIDFNKDLIIHIRSGDIFSTKFSLNEYKQPPLYFYRQILDTFKFNNIYICTENSDQNLLNPVIYYILKKYHNCTLLKNSIELDFKILINAKYLVHSESTLSAIVSSVSRYPQEIYVNTSWTNFRFKHDPKHRYKINMISTKEYYDHKNNTYDEKIDNMLKYVKIC